MSLFHMNDWVVMCMQRFLDSWQGKQYYPITRSGNDLRTAASEVSLQPLKLKNTAIASCIALTSDAADSASASGRTAEAWSSHSAASSGGWLVGWSHHKMDNLSDARCYERCFLCGCGHCSALLSRKLTKHEHNAVCNWRNISLFDGLSCGIQLFNNVYIATQ